MITRTLHVYWIVIVAHTTGSSLILISSCSGTFTNNRAAVQSGVMDTFHSLFNITNSSFINNVGGNFSGVMDAYYIPHLISPTVYIHQQQCNVWKWSCIWRKVIIQHYRQQIFH